MSSKIQVMPDVLASQVAAGEVVERPSSVIKELVENSLDAGAKTITVEITRGGIVLMKVVDDGCGMNREDALLCLERHATSKLASIDGLFEITHLGFRGEALPSIASISRLRLRTREHSSLEGCEISVEGGNAVPPKTCGMSPGTSIEISDIFFNTPARRKFLKSEETESAHIEHQLRLHALAFPQVRFVFRKNGQLCFDLPATEDPKVRIAMLTDHDTAANLIPIAPFYGPGITITGYLLPLSQARRTKKGQYVFLNKRPIEDKLVTRAIRDGYGGLPNGLHPSLYLYIDVEPALVDVNVHPAKREVRFRRPADLVTSVIDAISATLRTHTQAAQPTLTPIAATGKEPEHTTRKPSQSAPLPSITPRAAPSGPISLQVEKKAIPSPTQSLRPPPSIKPLPPTQKKFDLPPQEPRDASIPFRLIGNLDGKYGIFENEDGLVLMYPKAARERIIFEGLMAGKHSGLASQALLEPVMIELDPRDFEMATRNQEQFYRAGISLTPFGRKTIRVESLPAMIKSLDCRALVLALVDRLAHSEYSRKASDAVFEFLVREMAAKSAQMEKIELSGLISLLRQLLDCEVPYCTPSGKPTMIVYSHGEISRKFNMN